MPGRARRCYVRRVALSPLETAALADFRGRLIARFGTRLVELTLFGSRARGEGHEASDLDVLVLVRDLSRGERGEVLDEAWAIEQQTGLVISPLVRDDRSWNRTGSLARTIAEEGLAL